MNTFNFFSPKNTILEKQILESTLRTLYKGDFDTIKTAGTKEDISDLFTEIILLPVDEQLYLIRWVLTYWYEFSPDYSKFNSMIEKELNNPKLLQIREVLLVTLDCPKDSIFVINGEEWQNVNIESGIMTEEYHKQLEDKLFEIFNLKLEE